MDRKEFSQLLKAGNVQGAYLFEGVEENIKAATLQSLRKAILPEGMEELNESVMDAPATDAIIAACETLPFLADKRLVIVKEHPALTGRADADERLISYIPNVPESAILVFICRGKADARKKLYGAIKKANGIVSFAPLTDAELNSWIIKTFAGLGKTVSSQTASVLSFTVGSDTALLRREIEKLAALAGDRDTVTEADVHAVATRSVECTVFEMVDAVVAGQTAKAFGLLRDMLTTGSDRLGILAMLLRQFRLMQHIKIMQFEKLSPGDIKQRLGIAPFAAERCMRQASGYTGGQVKKAVQICLNAEYQVKSGGWNQEGALESAMLEIFALKSGF
ncbi:MAG: DNA polymerase III subunit delta [Clostridiales bacterium]|nr:DNA polymerase III subunit delta [Clostridiales bacterium]